MHILSVPAAISLLFGNAALFTAAYLYWLKEPEKAQAVAVRVASSIWEAWVLAYKIIRWPVTLLTSYVILIALTVPYLLMALVWTTMRKIVGEPAKVTIKLT